MREKLIDALRNGIFAAMDDDSCYAYADVVDYMMYLGVTIPVLCQNCTHHDTYTCPENKVWCKMLRRYMSLDGYCSYGERKNDEKLV